MPDEEIPAPATEPTTPPQEASPAPEILPSEPIVAPPAEALTAQMGRNEPLATETPPAEPEGAVAEAEAPQAQPPSTPPSPEVIAPAIVPPTRNLIRDILAKASAKIQSKKKAKLEKIMLALNVKNKITNDEVEKLLHVSDATATRYLSALEKEGRIRQVGKTGTGVVYQKI